MADSLVILEATARPQQAGADVPWGAILEAMRDIVSNPLTARAEKALLSIVRSTAALHFGEGDEVPHGMSPEAMLKSFAVQALIAETGTTYRKEFQRVEATTDSPALKSIIRAALTHVGPRRPVSFDIDVVATVKAGGGAKTDSVWLGGWLELSRPPRRPAAPGRRHGYKIAGLVQRVNGLSLGPTYFVPTKRLPKRAKRMSNRTPPTSALAPTPDMVV